MMKNLRYDKIILAVPKGRILDELIPLLNKAEIVPEKSFFDNNNRKLLFSSNLSWLKIIRVRSFDAATFVAYGGADMGVVGYDVLKEFDYPEIYAPIDLKIGKCHLSLASPKNYKNKDLLCVNKITKSVLSLFNLPHGWSNRIVCLHCLFNYMRHALIDLGFYNGLLPYQIN